MFIKNPTEENFNKMKEISSYRNSLCMFSSESYTNNMNSNIKLYDDATESFIKSTSAYVNIYNNEYKISVAKINLSLLEETKPVVLDVCRDTLRMFNSDNSSSIKDIFIDGIGKSFIGSIKRIINEINSAAENNNPGYNLNSFITKMLVTSGFGSMSNRTNKYVPEKKHMNVFMSSK